MKTKQQLTALHFSIDDLKETIQALSTVTNKTNSYMILDKYYYNRIINHDFRCDRIKNNQAFQKNIFNFIKQLLFRLNSGSSELTISHSEWKAAFDTSNYTIAKDFLIEVGLLRKKIIDVNNNGKIKYYQAPAFGTGVVTTYIIKPITEDPHYFTILNIGTNKKEKKIKFNTEVSEKFKVTLLKTKIDTKKAIKAELEHYTSANDPGKLVSLYKRLNRIINFGENIYTVKGKKSKRIFHSLSNLSSISRKYLSFNGESFNNIDIKNSQIVFFVSYCRRNHLEIDESFISDALDGLIYDRFYNVLVKQKEGKEWVEYSLKQDRKKVKEQLYSSIFFDFKRHYTLNKEFKKMYPLTWNVLQNIHQDFKGNSECNLSILLQNEEYELFAGIENKIESEGYFNLFDAVYFTDEIDFKIITDHIKNHFRSIGIENVKYTINE